MTSGVAATLSLAQEVAAVLDNEGFENSSEICIFSQAVERCNLLKTLGNRGLICQRISWCFQDPLPEPRWTDKVFSTWLFRHI